MDKKTDRNVGLYIYFILAGLLVLICIFPPQLVLAKKVSDYAVHIMMGMLVLGMLFLLLDQTKYMFVSFAYCGILSLFLKGNVNQNLKLPTTTGTPMISVAHFNLGTAPGEYDYILDKILSSTADVITINELTPDWDYILEDRIKSDYPYSVRMVRIDPFGLGIYSKKPLLYADTITYYKEGNQHLAATLPLGLKKNLQIITSYFLPPLTRKQYGDYRVELNKMGNALAKIKDPLIVTGDYNLSDWSAEMREFKYLSNLISSRRDVTPKSSTGVKSWMNFPVDHILFNPTLECSKFLTVNDSLGVQLGIMGNYQLRIDQIDPIQ